MKADASSIGWRRTQARVLAGLRRNASGRGWWPALVSILLVGVIYLLGGFGWLDRWLVDQRFQAIQRSASGDVVIVRIDPRSLAAVGVWPWPREIHGRIIDRMFAAGANEVALDIDLSAGSNQASDLALAQSLERAKGRVVLPVFRQHASGTPTDSEVLSTKPLDMFAGRAQLGGVTLVPGPDGLVRWSSTVEHWDDESIPSMVSLLAGPSYIGVGRYMIDYSIDPGDVPQISAIDVLEGRIPPKLFEGTKVIVGAAATELGDQHAVPLHRAMFGPMIQALSFESLVQDRALRPIGTFPVLSALIVLICVLTSLLRGASWGRLGIGCVAAVILIELVGLTVQSATSVVVTSGAWHAGVVVFFVIQLLRTTDLQAFQLFRQRIAMGHRRALMHRVLEDSFDGVIITDAQGKLSAVNAAACDIAGLDQNSVRGVPLESVLPEFDKALKSLPEPTSGDRTSHYGPFQVQLHRAEGERAVIELVIGRTTMIRSSSNNERRANERHIYSLTFRDITDRARLHEAQELAVAEAKAASRAKSEFLANMSHELRTPLNAVIGFSEMINNEILGPISPSQYGNYTRDIEESGRHLLQVINDILDVSRIELGRFELNEDSVDIAALLSSCMRIANGWKQASERDLVLKPMADLPVLHCDERLVKQSIINLLSNAVKYSRRGDKICCGATIDQYGNLFIEVADTGIGIAPQHLKKLKQPFYQVDASLSRKYEGVGLGLSLVNAYVEAHGGSMQIESKPDIGTRVRLTFPASRIITVTQNQSQARLSA